jgi:hypothetical protein
MVRSVANTTKFSNVSVKHADRFAVCSPANGLDVKSGPFVVQGPPVGGTPPDTTVCPKTSRPSQLIRGHNPGKPRVQPVGPPGQSTAAFQDWGWSFDSSPAPLSRSPTQRRTANTRICHSSPVFVHKTQIHPHCPRPFYCFWILLKNREEGVRGAPDLGVLWVGDSRSRIAIPRERCTFR